MSLMNLMDERHSELSEVEQNFIEIEEDMSLLPWQSEQRDHVLSEMIAYVIREQLRMRNPVALRNASKLAINALATQLAEFVGRYQLVVMPYTALMQSWNEQSVYLKCVGFMTDEDYFALVDCKARIIGVHVPKSDEEFRMESMINYALSHLDAQPIFKNQEKHKEARRLIEKYLWCQRFSLDTFKIRVFGEKYELLGKFVEVALKGGNKLQLQFEKKRNVLHYHIV